MESLRRVDVICSFSPPSPLKVHLCVESITIQNTETRFNSRTLFSCSILFHRLTWLAFVLFNCIDCCFGIHALMLLKLPVNVVIVGANLHKIMSSNEKNLSKETGIKSSKSILRYNCKQSFALIIYWINRLSLQIQRISN